MTSDDGEFRQDGIFASLPRTTRGLPLVLSATPDHKQILYCNGNSVYIRDIEDITNCSLYTEHSTQTTIAKASPSGFYIASGDQSGKVRIWDATQQTHILKGEYPIISGPIRDIAWSEDSKRLAVVGEGRERFGHVFLFDTGTSNGNLSGQSRTMYRLPKRQLSTFARPNPTGIGKCFRLASGSEDFTIAVFEGPPFKFKTLLHEHSRFVHSIRYNTDGSLFASGGADGKVCLFEGADGEKVAELVDSSCKGTAHSGSVFALAWSSDGQKLASASGDKTVKIWDVPGRQLAGTVTLGAAMEDQQLALAWVKDCIISINLAGFINYIDPETREVSRVIKGHNKPITALTLSPDKKFAFTADFEGNITRWEMGRGVSERVTPQAHKAQVSSLMVGGSTATLVSVGWDDCIAFTEGLLSDAISEVKSVSQRLKSQPRAIAALPTLERIVVACHRHIVLFGGQKETACVEIKFEGTSVAIHPKGGEVAVGGQDGKIRIYEISGGGNALKEKKELQHQGAISSLNYSPNGSYLLATDVARKVVPYNVDQDYKTANEKEWSFHTARVNCSAWSPCGRYIATGSLDASIMVWDVEESGESPIIIKGAHPMNPVNGIAWLSGNRLVSVGQDSCLKQWTLLKLKNSA